MKTKISIGDIIDFTDDTEIQDFAAQGFDDFTIKAGTRCVVTNVITDNVTPICCRLIDPSPGDWREAFQVHQPNFDVTLPINI